jgi:hypothetical protein
MEGAAFLMMETTINNRRTTKDTKKRTNLQNKVDQLAPLAE